MNISDVVQKKIIDLIASIVEDKAIVIDLSTPLIGDGSILDSMKLVELCLSLEDVSVEYNFNFDWTSDSAMSRSRSMFRTVGSLIEEFSRQMESVK